MIGSLDPRATFDTLVVGASNRLAVTAARAVADAPGAVYNPLMVYGGPGLGKTHLLMAIGHAVRAREPDARIAYLTADDFSELVHAAIGSGHGDAHRRTLAAHHLLLLDDVQFLAGRHELQQELLRIIDALQAASRQVVLASDRPPGAIEALDERLARRVAGGLVADLQAPDYETRVAILRRRADDRQGAFGTGVLEAVARSAIGSVRELLGAFNRLIAWQAASDTPLDAGTAQRVAGGLPAVPPANVAPQPATPRPDAGIALEVDEFTEFVHGIAAVFRPPIGHVDAVGDAIARWRDAGVRTDRLEALHRDAPSITPAQIEAALGAFERDVARLRDLERRAVEAAPEMAGHAAFRDPDALPAAEALAREVVEAGTPPGPSPEHRLAGLPDSPAMKVVLRSVETLLAEPGSRYNPLVLVGPAGAERTQLLHGIGNALWEGGIAPVACVSAAQFASELIEAIAADRVPRWRARYRRAGALLVEDLEALATTDRTQDEFFLLFNRCLESGRQMIFTAAVAPSAMTGLEARLRTRLEGGLVLECAPPPAAPAAAAPAAPARRTGPAAAGLLSSREKLVLDWPDLGDFLLEDWR